MCLPTGDGTYPEPTLPCSLVTYPRQNHRSPFTGQLLRDFEDCCVTTHTCLLSVVTSMLKSPSFTSWSTLLVPRATESWLILAKLG